jgi:hypothetical protein
MAPIDEDDTVVTYDDNPDYNTLINVEGETTAAEAAMTLRTLTEALDDLPSEADINVSVTLEQRGDD